MRSSLASLIRALAPASVAVLALAGPLLQGATRAGAQIPGPDQHVKEVELTTGAFTQSAPVPGWVEPTDLPEIPSSLPIALRLADTQFLAGENPAVFVRTAIVVNDASFLSSVGQISVSFVPQYQRLSLHGVHIHRGTDKIDRTSGSTVRFLERETGLEQGIYSGVVTASVLVSDLRVGDTLEYAYTIEGQNPVFGGTYVESASWDTASLVQRRRVILTHPVDRKINWRLVSEKPETLKPVREVVEGGMQKLEFRADNIAAVTPEAMVPPGYIGVRWLEFSEFPDWSAVVSWANAIFSVDMASGGELDALLESLRSKSAGEEQVAAALEFVQSNIRYFSVSLGESSHRPAQPSVVLKRRYGDCKDKTLLLISLLRALGIEANPVLLALGRRSGLAKSLPSPSLFDHAIVEAKVGDKSYFLDPSRLGQYGKLDRMGQAHEGAEVLTVSPGTKQLSEIRDGKIKAVAFSELTETATLEKIDGDGRLQTRQVWTGTAAEGVRVLYAQTPADRFARYFSEGLEKRFPGAVLAGQPIVTDDRINNIVTVTIDYVVPKMAIEKSGNWFVRIDPSNLRGIAAPHPTAERKAPLAMSVHPFKGSYVFTLKLPDGINIWSEPLTQEAGSKHISFTVRHFFRGNTIGATISLQTRKERIEPTDFKSYTDELKSVDQLPAIAVVIPGSYVKAANRKVAKASKAPAQQLVNEQREVIKSTTVAIGSGRLKGADLALSYCTRSYAHANLGEADKALQDANLAISASSTTFAGLACRANAYLAAGEFKKSVDDYSAAIAIGAPVPVTVQARGVARHFAGMLDEAAADFAQSSEQAIGDEQVHSDIWLSLTLMRLGRPLPDDLAQRAALSPDGQWPRPVLAMLHGYRTPVGIVEYVNRKSGDEKKTIGTEGYFFLGKHFLITGDTATARNYFEEARKFQVINYVEHMFAGLELMALGVAASQTATSRVSTDVNGLATSSVATETAAPTAPAAIPAKKPKSKKPDVDVDWSLHPLGKY